MTETANLLSLKHRVSKIGDKCLTSLCTIGGIESVSEHMSRGGWSKLVRCLCELDQSLIPPDNKSGTDIRETKHILVHPNLSVETKKLPNICQTITACTSNQLSVLHSFCSGNLGIGIRKRAPSLNNVEARTSLLTLQQADIVNMVDVDLSDLQEDVEQKEWLSPLAT